MSDRSCNTATMTRQKPLEATGSRRRPLLQPVRVQGVVQFADVMAAARKTAGMSADGLARRLQVSRSAISYRENGQRSLTVQDAVATLALCGYSLLVVPDELAERLEAGPDGPRATEG